MSDPISVITSVNKEYPIFLGEDVSSQLDDFIQQYPSHQVCVVMDEEVSKHHHDIFDSILSQKFSKIHLFKVPSGESSKSMEMYTSLLNFLLSQGLERSTPLITIGGGVTGDLAGFAAATVLRGIPLIHIPTTLLAMVDSSIGGKTGINHPQGKNLIGSFYQPDAVFADTRFLKSLPQSEWVNGLSEVVKYGMIRNPEILGDVRSLIDNDTFTDGESWLPIIRKSAQIKVDIVSEDVLESGKRAFLNFGHTFAHVIELKGEYNRFSHGEAVYAGMFGAVHASNMLGANIDLSNLMQFKSLYNVSLSDIGKNMDELVDVMRRDKKVKNRQIQLVLLDQIGSPYIYQAEDHKVIEQAWEFILNIFE